MAANSQLERTVASIASRVTAVEAHQVKILQTLERPTGSNSATSAVVTEALLNSVRDVASLQSATHGQIRSDPEKKVVHCQTCVPVVTDEISEMNRLDGVFRYDFSMGTSFCKS